MVQGKRKNKETKKEKPRKRRASVKKNKVIDTEKYKSIKNRYDSFASWPRKFSAEFIIELAVHGFFCEGETTRCVYCGFQKDKWGLNDTPSAVHSECFIHNLTNKTVRNKYNKFHDFTCTKCKGVVLHLKEDFKVVLCGTCGGINYNLYDDTQEAENEINIGDGSIKKENDVLNLIKDENVENLFVHRCCEKCGGTRKLKFINDLCTGEYNSNILKCIESSVELPNDKMDLFAHIINNSSEKCALDIFGNALEINLSQMGKEVEKQLEKIDEVHNLKEQ